MNCNTVQRSVQEYLEGRLSRLDRNEFVSHVSECAGCEAETLAWRDVFGALGEIDRHDAPRRVSTAVMAHLRAQDTFRAPTPGRIERFFGLPPLVRYPLVAGVLIAALYVPLAAALGLFRGTVATVVAEFAGLYSVAERAITEVSAFGGLVEVFASYTRAGRAVLLTLAGVSPITGAALFVAAGLTAFLAYRIIKKKKSIQHATFSF